MKIDAAGFTITEVLITVAVVGIMVSMAMPALNGYVENGQLKANTNDLYASLLLARSEAVTRNSRVSLCKIDPSTPTSCDNSESWESGWISFEDTDADGVRDAGETILDTYVGMSANTVVSSTSFPNTISYRPSGTTTTWGTINVCVSGNVAQNIVINATGRPRIADSSCP